METIFWCISSHTEEPSQASVTATTITTMATTPRKATKRNANRHRKSQRAHRGAPRYYVRGVLVAHCHRCKHNTSYGTTLTFHNDKIDTTCHKKSHWSLTTCQTEFEPTRAGKSPSLDRQQTRLPRLIGETSSFTQSTKRPEFKHGPAPPFHTIEKRHTANRKKSFAAPTYRQSVFHGVNKRGRGTERKKEKRKTSDRFGINATKQSAWE